MGLLEEGEVEGKDARERPIMVVVQVVVVGSCLFGGDALNCRDLGRLVFGMRVGR